MKSGWIVATILLFLLNVGVEAKVPMLSPLAKRQTEALESRRQLVEACRSQQRSCEISGLNAPLVQILQTQVELCKQSRVVNKCEQLDASQKKNFEIDSPGAVYDSKIKTCEWSEICEEVNSPAASLLSCGHGVLDIGTDILQLVLDGVMAAAYPARCLMQENCGRSEKEVLLEEQERIAERALAEDQLQRAQILEAEFCRQTTHQETCAKKNQMGISCAILREANCNGVGLCLNQAWADATTHMRDSIKTHPVRGEDGKPFRNLNDEIETDPNALFTVRALQATEICESYNKEYQRVFGDPRGLAQLVSDVLKELVEAEQQKLNCYSPQEVTRKVCYFIGSVLGAEIIAAKIIAQILKGNRSARAIAKIIREGAGSRDVARLSDVSADGVRNLTNMGFDSTQIQALQANLSGLRAEEQLAFFENVNKMSPQDPRLQRLKASLVSCTP